MTPFERLIEQLVTVSFSFHWFFKAILLIGMFFYLAFGVIAVRQVNLMAKTLNGAFASPIKIIAWIQLGLIIGLFLIILLA
ncbi:hypothetical protein A2Z41_02655 [Microgenomates group bacterium RBG_19FT_COMBO_39_10]|nr:MAG: hypothetical protein A2Z41_02655 [Microgenomates group bacterium RBG_19FT_COMBO_39_10]